MPVSVATANQYFQTRFGGTNIWAKFSDADKEAALVTGEDQLKNAGAAVGESAEDVKCICEQAFFLAIDPGIEKRLALRSQGVASAGLVQEVYRDIAVETPICAYARKYYGLQADGVAFGEIERVD